MSTESDNKMDVDGEGEIAASSGTAPESFKDKYRQLKSKLKYLVCVSVFELTMQYEQPSSVYC